MKQKISVRALIRKDGKVLIARRSAGRKTILGKCELPGGRVEFKEQPQEALRRHLLKSLKVTIDTVQLNDVVSYIDPDDPDVQYIFILYSVGLQSQRSINPMGRYNKHHWIDLKNIQHNLLTNSTEVLLSLMKGEHLTDEKNNNITINEDILTTNFAIIYSDGGSRGNPGPSAGGYVILNKDEQLLAQDGIYLGVTTNNQAEYQAVYQALKKAIELGIRRVDFRSDSMMIVNQLNGIYAIKNRELWPIHERIKTLFHRFDKITFSHVRREFNYQADAMVNKVLDERRPEPKL